MKQNTPEAIFYYDNRQELDDQFDQYLSEFEWGSGEDRINIDREDLFWDWIGDRYYHEVMVPMETINTIGLAELCCYFDEKVKIPLHRVLGDENLVEARKYYSALRALIDAIYAHGEPLVFTRILKYVPNLVEDYRELIIESQGNHG